MKQFILYARKAVTSPDFSLDDLPGSGGRMDLVARCVCSALWISHDLRRDSCIHVVACGSPNPPVVISFYGNRLRGVSPDERNIAAWIKKTLARKRKNPGINIRKLSFQQLVEELASEGNIFYVLHEKGRDIARVKLKADPVFILGDHIGLPRKEEKFVERFEYEQISLGTISYLASQCITVLHYELDKKPRDSTR
ncbi:MAG: tRNA (pseudouridine(54)-N(1))-methyltransferase TrmY [Methanophagales archaeon]|nr:tRNA (pseudouridine(54)-N(1))-methyltransferase TrmY [Methanophagales archaeon]RLG34982.1 MAG: tRNA (pseudouridine(54)-N(1))-methyltransferase TrmY [Methanosarcinales archaeon]